MGTDIIKRWRICQLDLSAIFLNSYLSDMDENERVKFQEKVLKELKRTNKHKNELLTKLN